MRNRISATTLLAVHQPAESGLLMGALRGGLSQNFAPTGCAQSHELRAAFAQPCDGVQKWGIFGSGG